MRFGETSGLFSDRSNFERTANFRHDPFELVYERARPVRTPVRTSGEEKPPFAGYVRPPLGASGPAWPRAPGSTMLCLASPSARLRALSGMRGQEGRPT